MTTNDIKLHLAKQFNLPEEQIEAMIPSFVSALQSHLDNLQEALENGGSKPLGDAGHKIKGACLNLGLAECAEIAIIIEEKGKAGDTGTDYSKLVRDLKEKLEPLLG